MSPHYLEAVIAKVLVMGAFTSQRIRVGMRVGQKSLGLSEKKPEIRRFRHRQFKMGIVYLEDNNHAIRHDVS